MVTIRESSGASADKLDRGVLLTAAVVVVGAIMSILDSTVVNVAIPTLAEEFGTSLTTVQWVATGYTLALATVIPLTAWAAQRFGSKRVYLVSIALFVIGSVLTGAAWNVESMIVFRVLQGLGGGMIMPIGMMILTQAAGPHRVGRLMAVMGIPMLLGPISGPILGGWFVDDFSWRWIFFINLPIGLIALILTVMILPRDGGMTRRPLDTIGVATLSPGLALLLYGFAESGARGGFGHAAVVGPLAAGAILLVIFVWHALRSTNPLIDLRLFKNKVFTGAIGTMVMMVIAVFGGFFLLPLYLQIVRGESALDSGLLMAPQGIGAMIAMPIAGMLADRTGVGRIVPVGLAIITASFMWMTGLAADTSYWHLSLALFAMGIGMGFTMMPTMTGAMQTLNRSMVPNGTTTLNISQQIATSIGTATMSVLLATAISDKVTAAIPPGAPAGDGDLGSLGDLPPALSAQIQPLLADAFGDTFWWAVGFAGVAFAVALVLLPKRRPEPLPDDSSDGVPMLMH